MTRLIHLFCIGFVILLAAAGCGELFASESPSEVVQAVYMAASNGNDVEVEKRLAAPPPANVEIVDILASGGRHQRWKPSVKRGSIRSVEILSEQKTTSRATVRFRLNMTGGAKKEMVTQLIKEGGAWKIDR